MTTVRQLDPFFTDAGTQLAIRRSFSPTPAGHPQPAGYRLLLQMPGIEGKTAGGILIPGKTQTDEKGVADVGLVVALGPDAYGDGNKFPQGPWCKPGDLVQIGRYGGHRFTFQGIEFRYVNDDEILGVGADPNAVARV